MIMQKRLNYIDALRGLTMVSVVMVHVLVRGFGLNPTVSGLAVLRGSFTLPLFFFVSGFFAWRRAEDYTPAKAKSALGIRLKSLLAGTIVFDTLYLITVHKNPFGWINGDFDSYWYTFTLLQIFILFIITVFIARACRRQWVSRWLLIVCGAAGFAAHYFIDANTWRWFWIMAPKSAEYLQFFVFGALVREYQSQFFSFLEKRWVLSTLIMVYIAALFAHYYYGNDLKNVSIWLFRIDSDVVMRYSGLMLVLYIFYGARDWFDRDTPFVRGWLFIGKRTLDIYFLHYFFIPTMRWVGPYLTKGNTIILQLAAGFIVAMAVIAVCLGISKLLRGAPVIRTLVGAKPAKS